MCYSKKEVMILKEKNDGYGNSKRLRKDKSAS